MENHMDRIDQPSGDNQPPSSGEELPWSLAPLQERPTTSPQQQLFKHITRLTLLQGILVGIWLVLMGVIVYFLRFRPKGDFHLAAPDVLMPLLFILTGAIVVLQWRGQILHQQLSDFRQSSPENVKAPLPAFMSASLGLFFLSMGCFMLIARATNLSSDVVFPIMIVWSFVWLIGTCGADLYLLIRDKRHTAQR